MDGELTLAKFSENRISALERARPREWRIAFHVLRADSRPSIEKKLNGVFIAEGWLAKHRPGVLSAMVSGDNS
jgi:hypothetical protein